MATTIITKFGSGAPAASDVVRGELAVDTENGRLYTETSGGAVIEIGLNPSGNVDVTGTLTATKLVSANGVLELDDNGTHNGIINAPASLFINIDSDGNSTGEDFIIGKDRTSTSGGTELFRVQEDGKVGIGTSSPAFGLSVESDNGSGYAALFRKSSSDPALTIQTTSSITQIQGLNSALSATNDIAMQLSGGNVGIGTASPDNLLHLHGSPIIRMTTATTGETATDGLIFGSNADGSSFLWTYENEHLYFGTNNTERVRITEAGNVGIGTTSPGRNLEIAGTGTDVGLNITKNTVGTVRFAYDSTGPYILDEDSNPFRIYTGGSERVRIDSSGNLLVRQTSAAVSDTHNGGSVEQFWGNQFSSSNSTNTKVMIGSGPNEGYVGASCLSSSGQYVINSYLRFDNTNATAGSDAGQILFFTQTGGTNAAERMRIESGGDVRIKTGSVVVDTAGQGIFLGGTGAANKLDDYEEGTWTGTLTGGTTAPSSTQQATGYYTKIGELVTLNIVFSNKDVTGVAGTVKVTGLPFTSRATSVSGNTTQGSGWCGRVASATNSVMPFINSSNEIIFVDSFGNGVSWASAGTGTYAGITISFMV